MESLNTLIGHFDDYLGELASQRLNDALTTGDWYDAMARAIAEHHMAAYMLGRGVTWDGVEPNEREMLWSIIGEQLSRLEAFADQYDSRYAESPEAFTARVHLYSPAIKAPWWEGQTFGIPLPAQPGDGTTQCITHCLCRWDIQTLEGEGNYDCRWVLGATDRHCQTCTARAARWNPLRVRDGIIVSVKEFKAPYTLGDVVVTKETWRFIHGHPVCLDCGGGGGGSGAGAGGAGASGKGKQKTLASVKDAQHLKGFSAYQLAEGFEQNAHKGHATSADKKSVLDKIRSEIDQAKLAIDNTKMAIKITGETHGTNSQGVKNLESDLLTLQKTHHALWAIHNHVEAAPLGGEHHVTAGGEPKVKHPGLSPAEVAFMNKHTAFMGSALKTEALKADIAKGSLTPQQLHKAKKQLATNIEHSINIYGNQAKKYEDLAKAGGSKADIEHYQKLVKDAHDKQNALGMLKTHVESLTSKKPKGSVPPSAPKIEAPTSTPAASKHKFNDDSHAANSLKAAHTSPEYKLAAANHLAASPTATPAQKIMAKDYIGLHAPKAAPATSAAPTAKPYVPSGKSKYETLDKLKGGHITHEQALVDLKADIAKAKASGDKSGVATLTTQYYKIKKQHEASASEKLTFGSITHADSVLNSPGSSQAHKAQASEFLLKHGMITLQEHDNNVANISGTKKNVIHDAQQVAKGAPAHVPTPLAGTPHEKSLSAATPEAASLWQQKKDGTISNYTYQKKLQALADQHGLTAAHLHEEAKKTVAALPKGAKLSPTATAHPKVAATPGSTPVEHYTAESAKAWNAKYTAGEITQAEYYKQFGALAKKEGISPVELYKSTGIHAPTWQEQQQHQQTYNKLHPPPDVSKAATPTPNLATQTKVMTHTPGATYKERNTSEAQAYFGQAYAGWVNQLTSGELKAIADYTSSGYGPLNEQLRGNQSIGTKLGKLKALDSALHRGQAPEDIVLHRGFDHSKLKALMAKGEDLNGREFHDRGYASSSSASDRAFKKSIRFVINTPKGSPGAYVEKVSSVPGELEYLLPRGSNFKINGYKKVTTSSGASYWEVKVDYLGTYEPKPETIL